MADQRKLSTNRTSFAMEHRNQSVAQMRSMWNSTASDKTDAPAGTRVRQ